MDMKDLSVASLSAQAASVSPTPGGESVSALAGAYSAALLCMVARFTVDRQGYEDVWDEMRVIIEKAESAREWLLENIQKDSEAYAAVLAAMSLPKDTDEQKLTRTDAIQQAFRYAADVPYAVAERAYELMELIELAVSKGNKNTVSDGLVAALLCRGAVLGAILNVRINLDSIKDEAYVADLREKCALLEQMVTDREAAIIKLAPELA